MIGTDGSLRSRPSAPVDEAACDGVTRAHP
jgi:hypothetical protein